MYLPNLIDLRSTHLSALARRLGAESETSETYDPVQRAAWDLAELLASREDDEYRSREAQEIAFYHEHGQAHPSERLSGDGFDNGYAEHVGDAELI